MSAVRPRIPTIFVSRLKENICNDLDTNIVENKEKLKRNFEK